MSQALLSPLDFSRGFRLLNPKWHTSRRWVCHWCFYHILTFSVIYYWTDPRQHGIYLFHTMIRKEKRSIHIPVSYRLTFGHDCSRICASLDIFKAHRYFSSLLLLFFFILLYTYGFLEKIFFLAQSRIWMAKTFAASLWQQWHTMAAIVKTSRSLAFSSSQELFLSRFLHFSFFVDSSS